MKSYTVLGQILPTVFVSLEILLYSKTLWNSHDKVSLGLDVNCCRASSIMALGFLSKTAASCIVSNLTLGLVLVLPSNCGFQAIVASV